MLRMAWRRPALGALAAAVVAAIILGGLLATGHGLPGARASGGTPLLPHLVADPPDGVEMVESAENPETWRTEGPVRLLLKFNGYVHNKGPGAVDFRGSREKPKVSLATEAEVESARLKHENLPRKVEEELAVPPMKVFQRLFTTNVGQEETNTERPHVDEPSGDEMKYVSADGHHHWHLQRVAEYGLYDSSKTRDVEPASKVGFCLDDSEGQHVEPQVGPGEQVYSDAHGRAFCQEYRPNATSVFEGISPGWRDLYKSNLAFQWVDVSNVVPGEYWLGEKVNTLGLIKETEPNVGKTNFASAPTLIPGFDALPQTIEPDGHEVSVTLTSRAWADGNKPVYHVISPPLHGSLGALNGNRVTYTPEPGYTGADSFQFTAQDPSSKFPTHPAIATVTVVGPPTVAINGAQAEMTAGASIHLTASVANDSGAVEWTASQGSIASTGSLGRESVFQAPSQPGVVTITARLADRPAVFTQQRITIAPVPAPKPAPEAPAPPPQTPPVNSGGSGVAGTKTESPKADVSRPRAMFIGRFLVLSTVTTVPGRLRLSAYAGKHLLGSCTTETPGGRRFTCRIKRSPAMSGRTRISVLASLRVGSRIYGTWLPAERILEMRMKHKSAGAHAAAVTGNVYWCSPSLVPDFTGGEE